MTNPVQNNADFDPLASYDKVEAVSFTTDGGFPEKTWKTFTVKDYIKLVQAKDDDGKPKFYEDSGKPVMKSVIAVVNEDGEDRSLWAKVNRIEGGLFRGLQDAQRTLGTRIQPGTKLAIQWWNDTTKPKKLGNHPKAYEVRATAGPAPAPSNDPLNESQPAATSSVWDATPAPESSAPPF